MTTADDYGAFPLRSFLDFDLDSSGPGHCVATTVVTEAHLNPNGVVHGGVIFTLVDTAMGRATLSLLPPGDLCASIEVHTRFLRPVTAGELRVEVNVVKKGSRIIHLDARALDDRDALVATATGSFAVLPARPQSRGGDV